MSLDRVFTENRRLCLLRVLAEDSNYTVNESILQAAIAAFGHRVSRDVVRADLAWLAEDGIALVKNEEVSGVLVATLTRRGLDCAQGVATVPGVARPGPID